MEALLPKQLSFPFAWVIVSLAITASLFYRHALKKSHGGEENGDLKLEPIPGPKRET